MICLRCLPLLAALLVGAPGGAVIRRHDRPDQAYLELGSRYPAVGRIGRRMGDGTLIGPRLVLTAAHVADGLMGRREPADRVVFFGGSAYPVVRAWIHPDWRDLGPHDIAVIELARPVPGIEPIPLYRGSEEGGREAVLVGHGRTGVGNSRERLDDDRKRGATNQVETVTPDHLVFRFDPPPGGTDLEGIPGAGDSGGPALLRVPAGPVVAGVSSAGQPGNDGPGSYGALDYFTRVSTHLPWLERVITGQVPPTDFGEADAAAVNVAPRPGTAGVEIPRSPAGRRVSALAALLLSAEADIGSFIDREVRLGPGTTRAALIERYRAIRERLRGGRVVGVLMDEPLHVDLLIRTSSGDRILGAEVEAMGEHRIIGVLEGRL